MITLSSQLIKKIRGEAVHAEKQGKLTSSQLDTIYQERWFHLLIPQTLGGKEMDLPTFARFMETLAWVDGSFAWAVNLGAGANMFAGFMEENIAKDIFESEKTCIAGSGAVNGTATRRKDGYLIEGYWKYASGSSHATHFSLNAMLVDANKKPGTEFRSFLVPADKVSVIESWQVSGLKATASHDFKVDKVWVHEDSLFNLQEPSSHAQGALYQFPFMLLAEINMVVMVNGLALRFLELAKTIAGGKPIYASGKSGKMLLEANARFKKTSVNVEQSFMKKKEQLFDCLDQCWQAVAKGEKIEKKIGKKLSMLVLQTAVSAGQLVDGLYPFLGMNVVFENTEINRVWRDFKTASQHALLSPLRNI